MRAIRVASAALLGVTALIFSVSAAFAENGDRDSGSGDSNITSFGFDVQPSTIVAGGQVRLNVEDCDSAARVSSEVFDAVTIPRGQSSAAATVDRDAKPGAVYEVTFRCGDESGHTDLTLATGRQDSEPTQVPVPVQQGVRAGAGGSVGDFDLKEIGLGAALIGASVGAAWYLSRRRTDDDDS
ncbi:hypothetical protein [Streptomyces sp. SD15]